MIDDPKRVPSHKLAWSREGDPRPGERYQHVRTGGVYIVESVALDASDPTRRLIVYRESTTLHCWVRSVDEFMDGRFQLVPTDANQS